MTATISGDGTSTLINLTTSGNTVLGDASTDTLNVGNGGLVKDASGNVGIGTISPNLSGAGNGKFLTILGAGATTTAASGRIELANPNTPATENECGSILFEQVGNNSNVRIATIAGTTTGSGGANGFGGYLNFYTKGDNVAGAPSERMRIDSSGRLLLNQSSNNGTYLMQMIQQSSTSGAMLIQIATNGNNGVSFLNAGGAAQVGTIVVNSASVAYNTSSDYRLKENIAPMTGALATVSQLKPVTYKWKADGSDGEGFIAHELAEVVPQCVTGEKDAVDADGNPIHQGIDTSFLVATLTAAIQELKALVDGQAVLIATQASTITQLQADVAALKAQP